MRFIITVFVFISLIGCDSGDPGGIPHSGFRAPSVPGIWLVDEDSRVHGQWLTPADGGLLSYPNPSMGRVIINFESPESTTARVWVVAAVAPGESSPADMELYSGSAVLIPEDAPIRTLLDGMVSAGRHEVAWDTRDYSGACVPTGFYRIFAQIGDDSFFVDQLVVQPDDIWYPSGLDNL